MKIVRPAGVKEDNGFFMQKIVPRKIPLYLTLKKVACWLLGAFIFIYLISPCLADDIDDIIPFIITCESSGNPNAVSKAGAIGLMQITPIVLEEWNWEHPTFGDYRAWLWVNRNKLLTENGYTDSFGSMRLMYGADDLSKLDYEPSDWSIKAEDLKKWKGKPKPKGYEYLNISGIPQWTTYKPKQLFDKNINMKIGEWYLRRLKDHYLKDVEVLEQNGVLLVIYSKHSKILQ